MISSPTEWYEDENNYNPSLGKDNKNSITNLIENGLGHFTHHAVYI